MIIAHLTVVVVTLALRGILDREPDNQVGYCLTKGFSLQHSVTSLSKKGELGELHVVAKGWRRLERMFHQNTICS